ncbi:helix-turn-helix domain-containing protein [Streptomyces acidiscabies]|uniref:DNA-binding protein n=1 Tax=Streptomyces acidiscabies TaxID=42234 RepID=A0A0L0KFZ2_9ACTN|nr:helix-turn-helix transcriptional regulator [Streptomyces acidiscabies]KND36539.1 DNA-binding protein [Streptomyces acidiscabies]
MTRSTQPRKGQTSTVLARKLGGELLRLRVAAGKTQTQAAESINATGTKIVKMEQGWVPMRDPDIRVLCEGYGLEDPEVLARLLELAKLDRERRKTQGWWRGAPYRGLGEFISMEDIATRIRSWQTSLIPGLLHTSAYTRALGVADPKWKDPDEIEVAAQVKQKRQERLLGEDPVQFYAVIWEPVLRQEVGGPEVMRGQMEKLLEAATLPNVRLQVLPYRAGAHPGAAGPFSILSFAEDGALDMVHSDTHTGMVWMENEEDSAYFNKVFDGVARLSLSPHDSVELIDSLRKGS